MMERTAHLNWKDMGNEPQQPRDIGSALRDSEYMFHAAAAGSGCTLRDCNKA